MRKDCGVGGQALLEGVMMRSKTRMALAVRRASGEIVVEDKEITPLPKIWRAPFIRGIVGMGQALGVGFKALMRSAEIAMDDVDDKPTTQKGQSMLMTGTVTVAIVFAIGLFFFVPALAANGLQHLKLDKTLTAVLEGLVRLVIFVGYLVAVSGMRDIQRTFAYHGAEHKTIHCVEADLPLTVENARTCSRLHPRCGTSFLLVVMVISLIVFIFLGKSNTFIERFATRILLLPVVASISYELLMLLAKRENALTRFLRAPGLWLQRLTTKEPDDGMLEVAIAAYNAAVGIKPVIETVELPVENTKPQEVAVEQGIPSSSQTAQNP